MKLYNTREAARYLDDMGLSTFRYHLRRGHLAPDIRVGGFLFTQATLDKFKREHQSEELTWEEAAAYLGVTELRLRYHVYERHTLAPTTRHDRSWTFSKAALDKARATITAPVVTGRSARREREAEK